MALCSTSPVTTLGDFRSRRLEKARLKKVGREDPPEPFNQAYYRQSQSAHYTPNSPVYLSGL